MRCMFMTVAVLCHFALPAGVAQTTTWVSQVTGSDDSLTPADPDTPFATISRAMELANQNPTTSYIIKIVDGDYTQAHESAATVSGAGYPIELSHPAGLTIVGVDAGGDPPSLAEYPRIGGDVGQDASALFSLIVTDEEEAEDIDSLEIKNLHFLGEDETSSNSPIAVEIRVEDAHTISNFFMQNNTFDRPFFNGVGPPRATIHIEVRDGIIDPQGPGSISGNTIYCSKRGGLEIISAAADGQFSKTNFAVDRNVFKVSVPDDAEFGLGWLGENMDGPGSQDYYGLTSVSGNTVLGRGLIEKGIVVKCEEHSTFGQGRQIDENVVTGCSVSGVELSVDGWGQGQIPELATTFVRNRLIYNTGSGLVLKWDENASADGDGYLVLLSEGNLIAKNGGYGIEVYGYGDSSSGGLTLRNETIAMNGSAGEGYFDLALDPGDWGPNQRAASHINCIMYGNGTGDGAQPDFRPDDTAFLADLLSEVTNSNWTGIAIANGNIDEDPDFVNHSIGDFHLSMGSPCIDAGLNEAANQAIDIDEEDRFQDGICPVGHPNPVLVDMGFDEFPEADCE